MNRPIKFRAWDIFKKTFVPPETWAVLSEPSDRATAVVLKDWKDYKEGEYFYPSLQTIMQFTGLTDKNGKEIYEGDILAHLLYDYGEEVRYEGGAFVIGKRSTADFLGGVALGGVVIGNIYENPELLS